MKGRCNSKQRRQRNGCCVVVLLLRLLPLALLALRLTTTGTTVLFVQAGEGRFHQQYQQQSPRGFYHESRRNHNANNNNLHQKKRNDDMRQPPPTRLHHRRKHHHHPRWWWLLPTDSKKNRNDKPSSGMSTTTATMTTILSVVGGGAFSSSSEEEEARNDVGAEQEEASSTTEQQPAAFVRSHRTSTSTTSTTNPGAASSASSETTTTLLSHLVLVLRALGPALWVVFGGSNNNQQQLITFRTVYGWTLAGTSLGFYLSLYFLSLGYGAGIFLAAAACLWRYVVRVPMQFRRFTSIVHSALVLAWAARLFAFLWWREYRGWPALHRKMVQVDRNTKNSRNARPTVIQKITCWLVYSFFYVCLLSPCWFRLQSDYQQSLLVVSAATITTETTTPNRGRAVLTAMGLALQLTGLLLETVADWQKSRFKGSSTRGGRYQWCRDGLWQYSTHPNYAGEFLFWLGTALAALPAIFRSSFAATSNSNNGHLSTAVRLVRLAVVLLGLAFVSTVLCGAARRLGAQQMARYGVDNPDYVLFRERTGVFGPKRWWLLLQQQTTTKNEKSNESIHNSTAVNALDVLDHNETTTTTTTTSEMPPPEATTTTTEATL